MSLSRRSFLAQSVAASAVFAQKGKAAARPNVLLILADDLAAWTLGCYGNKEIRTPNIDLLARAGTRFHSSFVCTPSGSASRATLFTGRTPRQHGIQDFLTAQPVANPPQGQAAPPPSFAKEVMLSDVLAGQGYACGYVGEWQMGEDPNGRHGFQYTYTTAKGGYQDPAMMLNGKPVEEKGYLAELLTRRACEFIGTQEASKPFFLTVGYLNPHTPYQGHPQKYYDMYAGTNFETVGWEPGAANALRGKEMLGDIVGNLRKAAAATTALDDQIPALLRKLQERKVRDNTLIIVTGDNGVLLGRHGLWGDGWASNPLNMYEEVMRVPMIWNWPGKIPVEALRPELVSFYDFVPSVCEATGAAVPAGGNLCGRSYFPLVTNQPLPKKQEWPDTVFGEFREAGMAREKRFKLVLRADGKGPSELFDLTKDAREKVNQYENPEYVTVRERLTRSLVEWRKKTGG